MIPIVFFLRVSFFLKIKDMLHPIISDGVVPLKTCDESLNPRNLFCFFKKEYCVQRKLPAFHCRFVCVDLSR
jgi:hypothetical protein